MGNKTLYSEKYNFEYYHIPKNGMTSIINSFKLKWVNQDQLKGQKVVCILRDPVDRAISSYFFLKKHPNIQNIRPVDIGMTQKMFMVDDVKGFGEYLNEIDENGYFDNHNLPQVNYLNSLAGKIPGPVQTDRSINKITDFIEFKHMNDSFKKIFNCNIEIAHLNRSSSNKELKTTLKSLFHKKIKKIYNEDYQLYKNYCQ